MDYMKASADAIATTYSSLDKLHKKGGDKVVLGGSSARTIMPLVPVMKKHVVTPPTIQASRLEGYVVEASVI